MDKPIYVITTFEHLPPEGQYMNIGCSRTPGYYFELETAQKAVEENWCDIWEHCYDYAVICEVEPGLYPCPTPIQYYKYNKNKDEYVKTSEPKEVIYFRICDLG